MRDSTGTVIDELPEVLKQAVGAVRAAGDRIGAVGNVVPTDSRSIVIEVNNLTKHTLLQVTGQFSRGGFGPTLPQEVIRPLQTDVFSVISDGTGTGVEGRVSYLSDGLDGLVIEFDDPFFGGNSSNGIVSSALSQELVLVSAMWTGRRCRAKYVLFPKDLNALPAGCGRPVGRA